MKNIVILLLFLLLFTAGGIAIWKFLISSNPVSNISSATKITPVPTPSPATILKVISGSAKIKTADNEITASPSAGTAVEINAVISTSSDSLAQIEIGENNVIRIAPDSNLTYQSQGHFSQTLGTIYIRVKNLLGLGGEFTLETPTVVAAVRGTGFASFIKNPRQVKLVATEHNIDLSSTAINEKQTLTENSQAESDDKSLKLSPAKLSDEEKNWIENNKIADENGLMPTLTPAPTSKPLAPTLTPVPTKPPLTSMPSEGLNTGQVVTSRGNFNLTCVGGQKTNTKIMTDSASDSDCRDNCPVMPLHEYAAKNGAYAAINGMYFCPPDYPQCADKKNSFDTLFFISRLKTYLNSANNIYSTLPWLAIESNGNPLFYDQTVKWGRDSGIQAGTAGNPLLVKDKNMVADEGKLDDKQRNVKSNRGAIVEAGSLIYACTVAKATVMDSADVYQALGADNAMNIDGGGSTALWFNGRYIFDPGRNLPTAIMFAKR
ncbi:phosphodiester glycosidase family protein [Candidatus Collierbacteria bacterium]|nr:phosphodiester glycosidase family protein [Candidatus Collierbacteria bacterium]